MNAAVLPQPPAMTFPVVEEIDISHLVTEDDTPVENFAAEQQMRLLSEAPNCSWDPGRDFIVAANVGVFCAVARPPIVPDVMVVLDVPRPPHDYAKKEYRSYFMWIYGKPPDIVVEIVSNREGGELDSKLAEYARLRVAYYAVYDPRHLIQETNLACFVLIGDGYEPLPMAKFKHTGLSLVEWEGTYEHNVGPWLRWADEQGNLILTGAELAEVAQRKAEEAQRNALESQRQALAAQRQANEAIERADAAELRAQALAVRLRAAGIDPSQV